MMKLNNRIPEKRCRHMDRGEQINLVGRLLHDRRVKDRRIVKRSFYEKLCSYRELLGGDRRLSDSQSDTVDRIRANVWGPSW